MAEDIRQMMSTEGVKEFEAQYELPHCVVLDSEYCSMGRMIGNRACQISGYTYYDAVLLLDLVPEEGVTKADLDECEKRLREREMTREELQSDVLFMKLEKAFDKAIDLALAKGPCLIHDRITKEEVIKKGYTCVSALTYGFDMDAKIVRAKLSPFYQAIESREEVIRNIQAEDMIRINTHRAHADTNWGDKNVYDLMINVDMFIRDYSAALLACTMKKI